MLSFPTQVVSAGAVQVSGILDQADAVWLEGDAKPEEDGVRVSGRLSAAGPGRYYFSGAISGSVRQVCGRCLGEAGAAVAADVHVLFADAAHVDDEDPDVFPLVQGRTGTEVDLRPALRQEWLLEVPSFATCRPDCKGLCPTCGTNLNQAQCSCATTSRE